MIVCDYRYYVSVPAVRRLNPLWSCSSECTLRVVISCTHSSSQGSPEAMV
jgi:hypothetical protein